MSPQQGLWLLGSALGLSLLLNVVLLTRTPRSDPSSPPAAVASPARMASPTPFLAQSAPIDPHADDGRTWQESAVRLAIRDFDAAVKSLDSRPPEIRYESAIRELASGVCQDRLDRLPEMLTRVPPDQRETLWQITFDHWSKKKPEALHEFARALPSGAMKTNAYSKLMEALTESAALDEALAVYAEMPVSSERQGLTLDRLARAMASSDPEAALAWAQTLATPEERNRAVQTVISAAQGELGMERLTALANSSADPAMQTFCVVSMARLMAEDTSPATASQWVQNLPEPLRHPAVSALRERFAEKDPEAERASSFDRRPRPTRGGNWQPHAQHCEP